MVYAGEKLAIFGTVNSADYTLPKTCSVWGQVECLKNHRHDVVYYRKVEASPPGHKKKNITCKDSTLEIQKKVANTFY